MRSPRGTEAAVQCRTITNVFASIHIWNRGIHLLFVLACLHTLSVIIWWQANGNTVAKRVGRQTSQQRSMNACLVIAEALHTQDGGLMNATPGSLGKGKEWM